jgi:hypothetical protein
MAWIAADGFDYYGSDADLARSVWDSVDGTKCELTSQNAVAPAVSDSTRFKTGRMLHRIILQIGVWLSKTIGSNESTLFVAFAYLRAGALSGTSPEVYLQFRDGATAQCSVVFQSNGDIVLKSGIHTGTVLATYAAGFAQDVWTHFQVRIVIHNTTGSITIRKNGSGSDSFAATGLNTRGGTANNYANVVVVGNGTGASTPPPDYFIDDLLVYSGSGAAPNDWVGDVRAIMLPISGAGASSQLTPSATTATFGQATLGFSMVGSAAPNEVLFAPSRAGSGEGGIPTTLTMPVPAWGRSGTLTKFTVSIGAVLTGSLQGAIYAVDPATGKPGDLLAVSSVATNPPIGLLDLPVTAGPVLASDKRYFLALLESASFNLGVFSSTSTQTWTLAQPFASGFPASGLAASAVGRAALYMVATVTDSVAAVNEPLGNGDVDYVYSSTVGHEDLYQLTDMPAVPAAIIGVVSKVLIKKSDTGTRNAQVRLRSGATDVAGADTVLGSTYTYLARVDTLDPATGAPWTLAAVNAIQVGQKVSA